MGKSKTKAYVPEALKLFGKCLKEVRPVLEGGGKIPDIRINAEGLQKAIEMLPKKDKECIEKFWGLTGGINHSKKLGTLAGKDVAYINMRNAAVTSMRKLFRLDYMNIYDENLHTLIQMLVCKIDNSRVTNISDMEKVKYLMSFFGILLNGPKMSFEEDPESIDTECDQEAIFDEYAMLKGTLHTFEEYPDNSINLEILVNFIEMMDFKDMLAIKKSLGIEIDISDNCDLKEIEILQTLRQIRNFKERIFKYGSWEVTRALIMGTPVNLEMFMKELNKIRKNWSRLEEFKTGQKNLRTPNEYRTLNIYNIGGLEFTDPYEVMFLYLQRNIIDP